MNMAPPPSLPTRMVLVVWRCLVVAAWISAGYVVVGSILWPYWWYLFFWQRGALQAASQTGERKSQTHAA